MILEDNYKEKVQEERKKEWEMGRKGRGEDGKERGKEGGRERERQRDIETETETDRLTD